MAEFILTGFGDEIDASLDRQMEVMDGLGIHFIETRGIDGKNIADYTPEEAGAIHARIAASACPRSVRPSARSAFTTILRRTWKTSSA